MYTGTGIYSLPEASRLISVPPRTLHRWLFGYHHSHGLGEKKREAFSHPLWQPELSKTEFDAEVIGFHDLLEVRFVAAFVRHGVPLIVVRRCLDTARQLFDVDYPLTT